MRKFRVGVSHCLLGERVRHDGQHKRHSGVVDGLGPHVEWIPVCPEVEMGMGVPREPILLTGPLDHPRLVGASSGKDWTRQAWDFYEDRLHQLKNMNLDGFVLKQKSPSCGLSGVPLLENNHSEKALGQGPGLFALALTNELPDLPKVQEEDLATPKQVQEFVEQMVQYASLKKTLE